MARQYHVVRVMVFKLKNIDDQFFYFVLTTVTSAMSWSLISCVGVNELIFRATDGQ